MPKKPRGTRDLILRRTDAVLSHLRRSIDLLSMIYESAEENSEAINECLPLLVVSFEQLENLVKGFRKQL